ncbi:MAG TPA: hypothetical protein VMJ32_12985 [Pirellulales bacterium]|nr:hypothetical protein [Pirellulales bacterium]
MLADGDHPKVGDRKLMLGVRIGMPPHGDVQLNNKGAVVPGSGGMSVARNWKELPYFLIPPRLGHLVPELRKKRAASGNDQAKCWWMGEGPFENSPINAQLSLRLDNDLHGLIEPNEEVSIETFQTSLAATRDSWTIDET